MPRPHPRPPPWDAADAALGEPISTLAWEGLSERLDLTENAQPALLAASIAIESAPRSPDGFRGRGTDPAFAAGHSMGQYWRSWPLASSH